jgi:hypothetical protein
MDEFNPIFQEFRDLLSTLNNTKVGFHFFLSFVLLNGTDVIKTARRLSGFFTALGRAKPQATINHVTAFCLSHPDHWDTFMEFIEGGMEEVCPPSAPSRPDALCCISAGWRSYHDGTHCHDNRRTRLTTA